MLDDWFWLILEDFDWYWLILIDYGGIWLILIVIFNLFNDVKKQISDLCQHLISLLCPSNVSNAHFYSTFNVTSNCKILRKKLQILSLQGKHQKYLLCQKLLLPNRIFQHAHNPVNWLVGQKVTFSWKCHKTINGHFPFLPNSTPNKNVKNITFRHTYFREREI